MTNQELARLRMKMKSLKTTYSDKYLNQKYQGRAKTEFLRNKALELKALTGVPFSVSYNHGQQVFLPMLDSRQVDQAASPEVIAQLKAALAPAAHQKYESFLSIHRKTNIALPRIMAAALQMIRDGEAYVTVNRKGDATYIRLR